MTNFDMRKHLPQLAEKYHTVSPAELSRYILQDYNEKRTPEAITVFFSRNPAVKQAIIQKQVNIATQANQVVESEILERMELFQELPSVKKWRITQTTRISRKNLLSQVATLRNICMGRFFLKKHNEDYSKIWLEEKHVPEWTFKHPDRITLDQIKEFIAYVHINNNGNTKGFRAAARGFLFSRDGKEVAPQDIDGSAGKIGKYADVMASKAEINQIFSELKAVDFRVYVIAHFSYKTATRADASHKDCKKSNLHTESGAVIWENWSNLKTCTMTITDKGLHRTGRLTWNKQVDEQLYSELEGLWTMHGEDRAFAGMSLTYIRTTLKAAYRKFLKGRVLELAMTEPMHFWRHMFAQHMLRATNWNYEIVAMLGGWLGTDILKKCYGAPTKEMLMKEGMAYLPTI